MKKIFLFLLIPAFLFSCKNEKSKNNENTMNSNPETVIYQKTQDDVIKELITKHGEQLKSRIEKGVTQSASLWRKLDGNEEDFKKFCIENFIAKDEDRKIAFEKISRNMEILYGYFNKISLDLLEPLHLVGPENTSVDMLFGAYSAYSHMTEDFYANKIAFVTILNFPSYTLDEKTQNAATWKRLDWAYSRLGDVFTSRVPADIIQQFSTASTNADNYISNYNIYMGSLVNDKSEKLFPKDMQLITHWGLRDELKSNYTAERGLEKQKMIYEVMKNIISQEIPQNVINKGDLDWNPTTNKVFKDSKEVKFEKEPDTRYEHLLTLFKAEKAYDAYSPVYKDYIQRRFSVDLEIPQKEVEDLFISLVSSPEIKQVAELIKKRLGRNLEPFDIWYNGFRVSSGMQEPELDKITKAKYPNAQAYKKDISSMLKKLQFSAEKADDISSKISVDPARGSGHAWGAQMKSDFAHLRTRIGAEGMNYKGYNVATHELGHTVEQTLTLYDIDYYMLNGVPNTAFTEALAFIFQKRDLMLLGVNKKNEEAEQMQALENFWSCYEIMGVSLVDMNVWKWMYENPNATSTELKVAVINISKEVWNKYYADIFGIKDQPILAIYSHMIDNPLYLAAYPLGHLIDFQIEKQIAGKNFSTEIQRIYSGGRIIPQEWMKLAVGSKLSTKPLLDAVDVALKTIK